MRQAQVQAWGEAPVLVDAPEPPSPEPGEIRLKVKAVGIHRVVRSRAAGNHYSTSNTPPPHVPGVDGVGETEHGRLVYWVNFSRPALSEYINLPEAAVYDLPAGADVIQVAAAINPAMSSWLAIKTRTTDLPTDFTAVILGATSASGRIAIPLVRSLGAKRIIGVARNNDALQQLDLEERVVLTENPASTDFSKLGDVDVVLDYVYGPSLIRLLTSLQSTRPVQYVQIGSLSATEVSLPSAILRSTNLTMRGSGPGAWSKEEAGKHMGPLVEEANRFPKLGVKAVPIEGVHEAWGKESNERLVITF